MRTIVISLTSFTPKLTLWEGTEDEARVPIKAYKRGKPYAEIYGVKHYLTEAETEMLKTMLKAFKEIT